MARDPSRQTSLGGLLFTLLALAVALGVVVWLVADTPIDGGSQTATDPPPLNPVSESDATIEVSPAPHTSGPATGGAGQ
ncbi:hypothetical protein BMI90_03550 [Thioclava sp. L04-15]|uniref:hypothetical protein n=1 Tax=Thioclava sp. L04-15 TaxID=1915318 RepID=UPI000996A0C5|nr:hypothetical protein [Thioclava sp. L04-15]OOY29338.1 hypothetical protein BMI90_03550 [Thioclava sp. L04-15]TNE88427.1 MAG: hypothetical protein EP337_09935 [Paracoccaceae bacterium]